MDKKTNIWLAVFFIAAMLSAYISFLFFGDRVPVSKIQFAGIVLCPLFSLAVGKRGKDAWLVRLALLFTVLSDWFLVIRHSHFPIALTTFTITQLFHAARLWENDHGADLAKRHILPRVALFGVLETSFIILFRALSLNFDYLIFMAVMYFSLLLMNVVISFLQKRKNVLFSIGLALFLCCDIFVCLTNVPNYLDLPESSFVLRILDLPIDPVWAFYFPSQVLIALSVLKGLEKTSLERFPSAGPPESVGAN